MSEKDELQILKHLADSGPLHPGILKKEKFKGFDDPFDEVKAKMLKELQIRTHRFGNPYYYIIDNGERILGSK